MAQPYKNKGGGKGKGSGGNDSAIGEAIVIILILASPLIIAFLPLFVSFEKDAVTSVINTWRTVVKPLVIFIDLALFGFLVFLLLEIFPLQPRLSMSHAPREKKIPKHEKDPSLAKKWEHIQKRVESPTHDNLRIAIIEGDSLIDHFLRKSGYAGESMAERLSQINPAEIKSLNRLWDAHRLRNVLVHTPGVSIAPNEAQAALLAYETFLKELGAL